MRRIIVCLLVLSSLRLFAVSAHPLHTIYVELRYNSHSDLIELTLRFFTKDVEDFFYFSQNKILNLQKTTPQQMKILIFNYLKEHLSLKDTADNDINWKWVGSETTYPYIWLYVQSPLGDHIDKNQRLNISTFCEMADTFNFLIETYQDDKEMSSLVSTCNLGKRKEHHH